MACQRPRMKEEVRIDKKFFVPTMRGERQFHLASTRFFTAVRNAVKAEGKDWTVLLSQGWKVEEFYGSEYE